MSGPLTPVIVLTPYTDGVHVDVTKPGGVTIPVQMARTLGKWLIKYADDIDEAKIPPLPVVTPKGDPIK